MQADVVSDGSDSTSMEGRESVERELNPSPSKCSVERGYLTVGRTVDIFFSRIGTQWNSIILDRTVTKIQQALSRIY